MGIALCALGAGSSNTATELMYWMLGIGVSASIYHPVGYALLSNSVRARGKAHGYQGVFGNLGIALAPLLGGAFSHWFSWQTAFLALGGVACISALVGALFPFDERVVEQESTHQRTKTDSKNAQRALLFILACAVTCAGIAYRGTELLLPKHLGDWVFGGAEGHASANLKGTALASITLLFASLGQIVGGRLADQIPLAWGYLLFHGLSLPFLIGLAYLYGAPLPLCAALYGFFALGMQPFENSLVARLVPVKWRSVGYGVKFVLTFGVGALSVEYVGFLTHQTGTTASGFAGLIPFVLMIIAFAFMLHWKDRPQVEEAEA